jgi:hypothetical protein
MHLEAVLATLAYGDLTMPQAAAVSLITAALMIASVNMYGFIIVMVLIMPRWLAAMNSTYDAIVRTTRARRALNELLGGHDGAPKGT